MQTQQFQLHAEIEDRHWWFVARRRIIRRLIGHVLPPSPTTTIVDIGCGTGANLAALAGEYSCVGIDTSPEAVALARQRFPRVEYIAGQAPGDLGDIARRAELFLLMDVLEHVPDDFALLSQLLSAASPGAYFLVTVPADEALWSKHDESFGHYRRYDSRRFEQLWSDLPVTTHLVSHFNSRLYWLIRAIRGWNRRRDRAAGQVGTDFWMPARPINRLFEATLAGEAGHLVKLLEGRRREGYRRGASLVALLERGSGEISVRNRPGDVPSDHHGPTEVRP